MSAGCRRSTPADDLADLISDAVGLLDDDIVVVTSKVVSKAEGAVVELATIEPSPFADDFAKRWDKDPRVVEVVLQQAARIVRMSGPLLITETRHGFVCANSGVDESSSGAAGRVVVLPQRSRRLSPAVARPIQRVGGRRRSHHQ